MSRTNPTAVIGVLQGNYDSARNPDLTGFIDTASSFIDQVVACAVGKGYSISSTVQELMERWLAAHLYGAADQFMTQKSTGKASASFQGQYDLGLNGSNYGQTALRLDPSGCLAAMNNLGNVGAFWLGKPVSAQVPYDQRN